MASRFGWLPGVRYTHLRDVRHLETVGFLDIDWRKYDFARHLAAAQATRPFITVARDVLEACALRRVLREAEQLAKFADHVVIVPKAPRLAKMMAQIPDGFLLGYSVPTQYGATELPAELFTKPVHLLGGRPDVQRRLANKMPVFSLDCNRFTLDAAYGDFFDGETFRPHPVGGYETCLRDSLRNINRLWLRYMRADLRQAA